MAIEDEMEIVLTYDPQKVTLSVKGGEPKPPGEVRSIKLLSTQDIVRIGDLCFIEFKVGTEVFYWGPVPCPPGT